MTGLKDVLNAITTELLNYKGSFRNSLVRPVDVHSSALCLPGLCLVSVALCASATGLVCTGTNRLYPDAASASAGEAPKE
jgi:hypothetical protein